MFKKIIRSLVVCGALCSAPTIGHAEELITTLAEGQPAPFDGTMYNTEAAARLLVDLNFSQESCRIEKEKEIGELSARHQFDINILTSKLKTCENVCEQKTTLRDEQIDRLVDDLGRARKPNQTAWFATGVVSGIALTVLSGWAIGQAAN